MMLDQTRPAVSTHSRLKAAGYARLLSSVVGLRFNTQPPEGGWQRFFHYSVLHEKVSTHSRLKAAGRDFKRF